MDFNVEPYWDDFESSNGAKDENYMRILFRPGYAVQARELTQIQSIIQNQIKNFGDHIFKDGSPVYGGHISLDTTVSYIKLQNTYNNVDIDLADFANRVVFNVDGTSKIRAKVVVADETQTQPTLMIRYLRGITFPDGNVIATSTGSYAQLTATDSSGTGSVASISQGVFYVDGYFVQVNPQTIVLDAYGNSPTYKIGLEISDEVVDESADANLLDPAQSSFNYQAPGAHRYKFALNLAKRTLDSIDDQKFFELLRVENGLITKQVTYPIYSEIEKTLARRTYDESGDYTVNPFGVSLAANTACNDVFVVNIEPGKAYVKGFEYDIQGTQHLQVAKARTQNTSTDYDLSLEYGNYLYANNVTGSANGLFNIAQLDKVEVHCVPASNINVAGPIGYNTTYMGTASVRNFVRASSSEYILYLSGLQLVSNTVNTVAGGNSTTIKFPGPYSNLNSAYTNVSVRVLDGISAGDVRKIVSYTYDGTNRLATVDLPFTANNTGVYNVSLLYNTTDIDSLVEVVSDKKAFNVSMNVSLSSRGSVNDTVIYDSNKDSLIFQLPESYIAAGSIVNADFVCNKFFEGKAFDSSGKFALTLSGNETYDYGTDGDALSSTTILKNIIIMAKTGGSAGQIITPTSVVRDSSTQLTITSSSLISSSADIYARVKVNNSESASSNRRTKTISGDASVTALRATDSPTNGTSVNGATNVKIDGSNGFIWFTSTSDINKTPGGNNSLYVSDVFKIIKVYDSGDLTANPSSTNAIDITNRYFFDPGQTLNYYDHSKIVLKPGYPAPKGRIVVMAQWYEHSAGINGYFDADSYPSAQYTSGTIPIFAAPSGKNYNLRDCIDFRPTRANGVASSISTYTFNGLKTPNPDEPMELTYSYYVPRIDKVVLTKDRELKTITGVAGKYPVEPQDSENAMTLYKLTIPAYTANPSDVVATPVKNKRYTMKDIGSLEARISNMEYYTALSIAEKKATDTTILYEDNATQKEKYGIVADNFTGFNVADAKSPEFICAVDGGKLFPYKNMKYVDLVIDQIGTNAKKNDKTISLPYTEEVAVEQLSATSNVTVQPYLYGKFDGNLRLTPASDSWFSISLTPVTVTSSQIIAPITITPPLPSLPIVPDLPISPIVNDVVLSSRVDTSSQFLDGGVWGFSPRTAIYRDWFDDMPFSS